MRYTPRRIDAADKLWRNPLEPLADHDLRDVGGSGGGRGSPPPRPPPPQAGAVLGSRCQFAQTSPSWTARRGARAIDAAGGRGARDAPRPSRLAAREAPHRWQRAHLWQVQALRELPLDVRETIAEVLGSEAASNGLDHDENPNAYGVERGQLLEALGL
jgi:hypothetical protein